MGGLWPQVLVSPRRGRQPSNSSVGPMGGGGPPNVITGNSSSISSFSSNSELAILLEYHYPTILMTTLQPYSPYPRYGGSALTVVIVL